MHEGDDENLALAQVIEDAPGIGKRQPSTVLIMRRARVVPVDQPRSSRDSMARVRRCG
jgi:hypothetical protein